MAKYLQETVRTICRSLESGLCQKDAAILAGISEDTFYTWLKEKSEFSELVGRSLAIYKRKLIRSVNRTIVKDGKLALEVLSRRWPAEYGSKITPIKIEEKKEYNHKVSDDLRDILLKINADRNQEVEHNT